MKKTKKQKPIKMKEEDVGKHHVLCDYECVVCGNFLERSDRYCSECGTELDWSEYENQR